MTKLSTYTRAFGGTGARSNLFLVRGLPGSGKSTQVKNWIRWTPGNIHLEADMFFEQDGSYQFDASKLHRAHDWCLTSAKIMLSQGHDVYISNTFTTFKELKEYAKFAFDNGHGLVVCTMHTYYGSIHDVPEETMQRMRDRFESHEQIMEKIDAL